MKKQLEIQSFDFSTIGEEPQLIIESPEKIENDNLEEENTEHAVECSEIKQEEFNKDYFSSEYLKNIFKKEIAEKTIGGKNISVDAYLKMAYNDLKIVGQMDKRLKNKQDDQTQVFSVIITMIKWLNSIRSYVNMAIEISKFHNSNIDLSAILNVLSEAISQREYLKHELEDKMSRI